MESGKWKVESVIASRSNDGSPFQTPDGSAAGNAVELGRLKLLRAENAPPTPIHMHCSNIAAV